MRVNLPLFLILSSAACLLVVTSVVKSDEGDDFSEFDYDDHQPIGADSDAGQKNEDDETAIKKVENKIESSKSAMENNEDEDASIDDDTDDNDNYEDSNDDYEFDHLKDDEEFEGLERDDEEDFDIPIDAVDDIKGRSGVRSERKKGSEQLGSSKKNRDKSSSQQQHTSKQTLKQTQIPSRFTRRSWDSYYIELVLVVAILLYFINYLSGRSKNQKIAQSWLNSHRSILESNFALVGDDGVSKVAGGGFDSSDSLSPLVKQSEHQYLLWCSGRACIEGMLVELQLLKRQDIVSFLFNRIRNSSKAPAHDQISVRVFLDETAEMDPFVLVLGKRRSVVNMVSDLQDLNTFVGGRRISSADRYGVKAPFFIAAEMVEVENAILDAKVVAMLNKFPDMIESMHLSDQYTGLKPSDVDSKPMEIPETRCVINFVFNVTSNVVESAAEDSSTNVESDMVPLMSLVFYMIDKVKRLRISREAKMKADKNRQKACSIFYKSIHAARAERAQDEKERKRREMKDKIMEIEDPEKQRRLEEKELKREKKKGGPRMKKMKIKSM